MSLLQKSKLWNTLQGLRLSKVGNGQDAGDAAQSHLPFWLRARFIGPAQRKVIYQLCGDLLDVGLDLTATYRVVAETMDARGKRGAARILREMADGLGTGQSQTQILEFAHGPERIFFTALQNSDAAIVYHGAARMLGVDSKIKRAVSTAILGPSILTLMLAGLFVMLGLALFPAFEGISPRTDWPAVSQWIAAIAEFIAGYGIWLGAALGVMAVLVAWALPNFSASGTAGRLRQILDRLPPFSFYRLLTGTSFLFTTLEMARAGGTLNPATLEKVAASNSPYTRAFIDQISARLFKGESFGHAVSAGGYWPDRELNAVFGALSDRGADMGRFRIYLDTWLEAVEATVAMRARGINGLLLALIAATISGAGGAIFGIVMNF